MKQIIQSFKSGQTILEEVPAPQVRDGHVVIRTTRSLVSLGTERMLVEFGKASLIQKARQQPEKVKMVLDKIKADGLIPTMETVFNKLEQPLPLGYCNVGVVEAVGKNVSEFKVGDRVASNGQHAEFVCVPKNLVASIPNNVSDEDATFTVVGSIGLQGIRLLNPTLGETIVVTGLGLIGLITAQLLKLNGCRVIGIDIDPAKIELAERIGIMAFDPRKVNPVKYVNDKTNGVGADGVIITASTKSDEIISQAALMSRKRGRIILVGVIGLNLSRADFYEKELTFQVSCSYGPGRYDYDYEQKGLDYPISFVRWTEKRNFEAILNSISDNMLSVKPLITDVVPLEKFEMIYGNIGTSKSIASIISYPENREYTSSVKTTDKEYTKSKGTIGIIGAGNFTKMTLLHNLKDADIKYIASAGGVSGTALAKKYSIPLSTSNYHDILDDGDVDAVIITTRHNLHAPMVLDALKSKKHVFVEKPLCLNQEELSAIIEEKKNGTQQLSLTVGFNRRFSPHIQKIKKALPESSQKNIVATMNAGAIPANVWIHDMEVGGGRIIGEACHLIDLITFLTGSKVVSVCMNAMGMSPEENVDSASILLKYENGDTGVVNYFANGNKAYSKERVEVYFDDATIIMDNYRQTVAYGVNGLKSYKSKLDKGHRDQFELYTAFLKNGGKPIIPFSDVVNATKASFAALESMKTKSWIDI